MKLAKKHIKRMNDLLNGERVAYNAIDMLDGIVSCAGSLRYWENMRHHFVPHPQLTNTVSPTYYGA